MIYNSENHSTSQQMTTSTFDIFHFKGCGTNRLGFHSHDFYELYIFIEGNVSYFIEEKRYDLQKGDVLLIPPGQIHRLDIHGTGESYERIILWIRQSYISQLNEKGISLVDCLSNIANSDNYHYRIGKANFNEILLIAAKIIEETDQNYFGCDILKVALFIEFLIRIGREFSFLNAKKPVHQSDTLIPNVIAYINENFTKKLTIDSLTRKFFVSKSHLLREFKKYTKCTIYQYILMKRMAYIKKLINSGTSVSKACMMCGFNDYSSFYKSFVKSNTISPKDFKQHSKK